MESGTPQRGVLPFFTSKLVVSLFLLLFLASCARIQVAARRVVIDTRVIPTSTISPFHPSPSITPAMITPTSATPCDPSNADFCITEGHFILQRPIRPPADDVVDPTYTYGSTANGTREPHHGVEFPNKSGTPVYAAGRGTVLFAGPDREAIYSPWTNFYGNLVVIEHADQLFTLYAHLSNVDVAAGQQVFVGDKIGEVGLTGVAIGSHLHFEVRQGNVQDYFATQNPELWLAPARDKDGRPFGALMISVVDSDQRLVDQADYTIKYYPDPAKKPAKSYYGMTYAPDMLSGPENAVLGELTAGHYRIVVARDEKVYEHWVEVESGKLTQVVFVVK